MKLANAPASGEVVQPQRAAERLGNLARDHAIFGEDRNHERQDLHEVWRIVQESLAFAERFVDEANLALL